MYRLDGIVVGAGLVILLVLLIVVPDYRAGWEVFKDLLRVPYGVPR